MNIIECPRDAMQGIDKFIPTNLKVKYINELLKVGFHTLDLGSFVSPKAVPQMADTSEVLNHLSFTDTNVLVIIANERGVDSALEFDAITHIGYPLSISETFQERNTNRSIADSIQDLERISSKVRNSGKELVIYLSMAFGNPYNDEWNKEILLNFINNNILHLQPSVLSLADTTGEAKPEEVGSLFSLVKDHVNDVKLGLHLHSQPNTAHEKIKAGFDAGCRRFDGALGGYGGCPFAKDELVGNIDTNVLLDLVQEQGIELNLNTEALNNSRKIAAEIFLS